MKGFVVLFVVLSILMFFGCGDGGKPSSNPVVIIQTELGNIEVELYPEKALITAANFLAYVDSSMYENGRFHRTVTMDNQPDNDVKIEVIQGGRSRERGGGQGFPSIKLERTSVTGILHKDGAISMARGGPDSATSDFFICINDQPSLDFGGKRNSDGQGFAAFGKVISGMDVVKMIHTAPVGQPGQYFKTPIKIINIVRKN